MSTFVLKLIAASSMLIDHIGYLFFDDMQWLRIVGRLAFPIFAFLIVEGAVHTRDFKKYVMRLSVFALISEIPFNLAMRGRLIDTGGSNVLVTFVIGLICIALFKKLSLKYSFSTENGIYGVLIFLAGAAAAYFLHSDYGAYGVMLIYVFYVFRDRKLAKSLLAVLIFGFMPGIQIFASVALVILWFYNGREGYKSPAAKWGFYLFYPLHLFVLYMIKIMI